MAGGKRREFRARKEKEDCDGDVNWQKKKIEKETEEGHVGESREPRKGEERDYLT